MAVQLELIAAAQAVTSMSWRSTKSHSRCRSAGKQSKAGYTVRAGW